MTIYEFCELFTDTATVEVFSFEKGETIYKGYSDEIPESIGESEITSIDPVYKESDYITINID
ncbi:MAG: hypothetical protein U0M06_05155 [Clostridia bacterium]|nr:hypothetical protein [Clostridia bacterium]